jgi:Sec-independent protein translocase protein TatA
VSLGPAEILVLLVLVLAVVVPRRLPESPRHLSNPGRVPRRDVAPGGSA